MVVIRNPVKEKSVEFAIDVIKLSDKLQTQREYVISKQILRSGTAIGALVREADQAESKADFVHKLSIALKEASETEYWLLLLLRSEKIDEAKYYQLVGKVRELIKLLVAIIKTSKMSMGRKVGR